MTTVLALKTLFDAVVERFDAESTECAMSFGWKEPAKLAVSARITWAPGDQSGSVGDVGPARQPGRNPRPLATLRELCTVSVQAYDPSAPTDESSQYEATRLLYDAWYRAVYLAARGTFEVVSTQWVRPRSGMTHGCAIQTVIAVDAMIPDAPLVTAGVGAEITTELLDVAETDAITP